MSLVEKSLTKTKHKQAGENASREWLESEANLSRKSFSRVSFGVVQSFGIFTATFPLSFAPEHTLHLVKCHVVTRIVARQRNGKAETKIYGCLFLGQRFGTE